MADAPPDRLSEGDNSNDNMEHESEVQVTNLSVPTQDEGTINQQEETDSEILKEYSTLASLVATYFDDSE